MFAKRPQIYVIRFVIIVLLLRERKCIPQLSRNKKWKVKNKQTSSKACPPVQAVGCPAPAAQPLAVRSVGMCGLVILFQIGFGFDFEKKSDSVRNKFGSVILSLLI